MILSTPTPSGILLPNTNFKDILSIGFEFECADLIKTSLHSNKKSLVVSDLALRTLKDKIENNSITLAHDPHYLLVRMPIDKKYRGDIKEEIEDDEFIKQLKEEYPEEYEKEQQAKEEKAKEEREKVFAKVKNSYPEYFYENRKTDNKNTIKFQITNDLADTTFNVMLKKQCAALKIPKNDMYFFRTNGGKLYDFKFSEDIATDKTCEAFSSVEFVATYLSPKENHENIIIDTFVDACSRIVDHLGDLKKIKGELLFHDNTHFFRAGNLGKDRCLYHKPGTNLFYMDSYDDENVDALQTLGDALLAPQMTFRSKAPNTFSIMKEIVNVRGRVKKGKSTAKDLDYEYNVLVYLEECVDKLFQIHNETAAIKIDKNTDRGKTLHLYLFLIFYKLNMFIIYHASIFAKEYYLKDFISFSSRHSNIVLFERIKEILKTHYGLSGADDDDNAKIYQFINQPKVLKELYEKEEGEEDDEADFDENDEYKYNYDAHVDDLSEDDPNFGNPLYSMPSYFKYFDANGADWLRENKYDTFSTTFELHGDEVLIEDRNFMYEINLYLKNNMKSSFANRNLTIHNLHSIVNHYYGNKMKKMITLTRDPKKHSLTRRVSASERRSRSAIANAGPTSKYNAPKSKSKSLSKGRIQVIRKTHKKRLSPILESEKEEF
jgi:hypothetical protein